MTQTAPNIARAVKEAQALLGDRLSTNPSVRNIHGQSEAHYAPAPPDAVAFVQTTQEVSALVKICAKHRCPIIAWGVGTALEGHTSAIHGGITVDFAQMNKVVEIFPEDLQITIQPGITRKALNHELRATGMFFPVDPGADATLGGMCATRASGTTTVRYGTMRDNVLSLELVLANGTIMRTGSRAKKSATGYDLTGLMIGSEGTLAIITEITLALYGQPEAIAGAICDFPTIESAVDTVIEAVQSGVQMARIELVDSASIQAINRHSHMQMPETPHLFLEFHGTPTSVREEIENLRDIAVQHHGRDFDWSGNHETRNALWAARHAAYPAIKAMRPGWRALTTDICVPISKLGQAINETITDLADNAIFAPIVGHVGDGNYHCCMLIDPDDSTAMQCAQDVAHRMAMRALALGGTVSGEHGIGIGKQKYMHQEHGHGYQLMRAIKGKLDPDNILNPGKLIQMN